MNYSNINEADGGIDIDNLNYNDYVKLRMKSQPMKGMDKAEKSELFKIIGKEWKSLKDLANKKKSKPKADENINIDETKLRNEVRNIVSDILNLNEAFDPDDDYGRAESEYFNDAIASNSDTISGYVTKGIFKNDVLIEYINDYVNENYNVDVYDSVLFDPRNSELVKYYKQNPIVFNNLVGDIELLAINPDDSFGIYDDALDMRGFETDDEVKISLDLSNNHSMLNELDDRMFCGVVPGIVPSVIYGDKLTDIGCKYEANDIISSIKLDLDAYFDDNITTILNIVNEYNY